MDSFPYKEILLLILGSLSSYLVWRVQYQKDRLKNIENQLSDKKYKMYSELIYILFDLSQGEKLGQKMTHEEMVKKIFSIKRDMFLYAPDIVFKQFTDWLLNLGTHENMANHFNDYYKLIKLVRMDMGNKKTQITRDDFMLFYMQNRAEYELFKSQNGW